MKKDSSKSQSQKRALSHPGVPPSRKHHRRGENADQKSSSVDACPFITCSNSWTCENSACGATLPIEEAFCKRCSCCICHSYKNEDLTLWLKCSSELGEENSCGSSCHIECALKDSRVGVVYHGDSMELDGNYSCASCGKVSEILGFLKRQLAIAKDASGIDVLCYRINLSYRLLDGTSKFKELYTLIEEAKTKIEMELGPINRVSDNTLRSMGRLSMASDVQTLCNHALEKADELLAKYSNSSMKINATSYQFDLNVPLPPDLNEEFSFPVESPSDKQNRCRSGQPLLHSDVVANDIERQDTEGFPDTTESHNQDNGKGIVHSEVATSHRVNSRSNQGIVDSGDNAVLASALMVCNRSECVDDFDYFVKVILYLESGGHIKEEFRLKFLSWLSSRATERHHRVLNSFIRNLIDKPSSLAEQLVDAFSDSIFS